MDDRDQLYTIDHLAIGESDRYEFLARLDTVSAHAIHTMESTDPWPVDFDPTLVALYDEVADTLGIDDVERLGLQPTADLVVVLGLSTASRSLALFEQLSRVAEIEQGLVGVTRFAQALKAASDGDKAAQTCLKLLTTRVMHLERMRCLQRIFSPERAKRLLLALKECSQ